MENLSTTNACNVLSGTNNMPVTRASYSAVNAGKCTGSFGNLGKKRLVTVCDPYDKFSMRDREAMAHSWHFQLISSECFLADFMFKYVHELEQIMYEKGLVKFNLKKSLKELISQVESLKGLVKGHGKAQIMVFCRPMFAPLVEDYCRDGGDLTDRLICSIYSRINQDLVRMFYCTKNMINRTGCPHPDVVNHLQMIMFLVNTDIEFTDIVRDRVTRLLAGFDKGVEYVMSPHNAKIQKAAKDLLRCLYDERKYEFHETNVKDVRTLARVIQEKLVGEKTRDAMDDDIWAVRGDFALYVLLRLAMRLQGNGDPLTRKELKHLLVRLGSKDNVKSLIDELSKTALPQGDDIREMMDEFDVPEDENSMMRTFFRLCMEDKVMYGKNEPPQNRAYRQLRQMIYRSKNGTLPKSVLEYMYHAAGTKKFVIELMNLAGKEVTGKSLKLFRSMKASDMDKPADKYIFHFGHGLERARIEAGLSVDELIKKMGISRQQYRAFADFTSLKYGYVRQVGELFNELAAILKMESKYILYLSIERGEGENLAVCEFNHVLHRGAEVYLGFRPEDVSVQKTGENNDKQ